MLWFGKGINRGVEILHITQPNLSRQLSQLEEEVGVKLFHRGARKIALTNEGILLRRRVEEISSLVDKTEKEQQPFSLAVTKLIEHMKTTYAFEA